MTDEELIPRKRGPARGARGKLTDERKRMLIEMAAAAYVRMQHGDYKYPDGAKRGALQEDGTRKINKRELMRIAGYKVDGTNTHYEYLEDNEYYQDMIVLYERRYTDPLFRDDAIGEVWKTVGNEALRNVYERLVTAPHSLTIEQLLKVIKTVLDAGMTFHKMGGDQESKSEKLIQSIKDPEMREELKADYKRKLMEELRKLDGNQGDV